MTRPYKSVSRSVPAELIAAVRKGLEAGKTHQVIASGLGETLSRVVGIACRHCPDIRRIRPVPPERIEAIKAGVAEGLTYPQIASRLGLSTSTVQWTVGHHIGSMTRPKRVAVLTRPRSFVESASLSEIRRGIEDGLSYSQIAAGLGMTRNGVAGLVARHLKDVDRPVKEKKPAAIKEPRVRVAKPTPAEPTPYVSVARITAIGVTTVPAPAPALAGSALVPFVRASGCRWPLWDVDDRLDDKTVCGSACGQDTYCSHHRALAYRPYERRRRAA